MKTFLFVLVLSILRHSSSTGYPNCIHSLTSTNQSQNFNNKFLKLTQFLLPTTTSPTTSVNLTTLFSLSNENNINFFIIIGSTAILSFLFIFIRTKASYKMKVRMFLNKDSAGVLGPCIFFLTILAIVFIALVVVQVDLIANNMEAVQCRSRYTRQIIMDGSNTTNWAGLQGFVKVIQKRIKYLEVTKTMSVSSASPSTALQPRLKVLNSLIPQFQQLYKSSTLQFTDPTTQTTHSTPYQKVLPQLFTSKQWLSALNTTNINLYNVGTLGITIEKQLQQIRQTSADSITGAQSKIKGFKMLMNQMKKVGFMDDSWMGGGEMGSGLSFFIRIGLALGLQACFSYLVFILILSRVKHGLTLKMTNFIWVLIILELVFCLIMVSSVKTIATNLYQTCPTYQQLLYNKTFYLQTQISDKNPSLKNLLQLFSPCLYPNTTASPTFTYFSQPSYEFLNLILLLENLQNFANLVHPTSQAYVDLFQYQSVYDWVVAQIDKERFNVGRQNWDVIGENLEILNNYTLFNFGDDKCYKHRWVYSLKQCQASDQLVINTNNNLLLQSASYSNSAVKCLSLTSQNSTGSTNILSYAQFASNYMQDTSQARCSTTLSNVLQVGLTLISALSTKEIYLHSLQDSLLNHKIVLSEVLRLIRTMQLQILNYYQTIVGLGITATTQSYADYNFVIKDQNDCSPIKDSVSQLYQTTCIATYSNIMTVYFMLMLTCIVLAMLICVGLLYGINEEVKQIEHLIEESDGEYSQRKSEREKEKAKNWGKEKVKQKEIGKGKEKEKEKRHIYRIEQSLQ